MSIQHIFHHYVIKRKINIGSHLDKSGHSYSPCLEKVRERNNSMCLNISTSPGTVLSHVISKMSGQLSTVVVLLFRVRERSIYTVFQIINNVTSFLRGRYICIFFLEITPFSTLRNMWKTLVQESIVPHLFVSIKFTCF